MIQELFFDLIRIALGRRDCLRQSPSEEDWSQLYMMAQRQTMVGVCYAGLMRMENATLPPQRLLMQWIGIGAQIEERNKIMNSRCLEVQQRLLKDGFRSCILKGQGNALMYEKVRPKLGLVRQCGDIDVWVESDFEKLLEYVEGICPTTEVTDQHIQLGIFKDTKVEVHYIPSQLINVIKNRKFQKWLAAEKGLQMSHSVSFLNQKLIVPEDDFNMVYQLTHIYMHFFSEGIGLRQLADYYVLLNTSSLNDDKQAYVRKLVREFGMESFAQALMWVLGHVFLLEESFMLWNPDEKRGRIVLDEVMQTGNMGHSDERYKLKSKDPHIIRYWIMVKSKMRFLRYFPNEVFWLPVSIFISFFVNKSLRKEAQRYIGKNNHG